MHNRPAPARGAIRFITSEPGALTTPSALFQVDATRRRCCMPNCQKQSRVNPALAELLYRCLRCLFVRLNAVLLISVGVRQRIIPHIAVQIPALRVARILIDKRIIR